MTRSPLVRYVALGMCVIVLVMWMNRPEDTSIVEFAEVLKFRPPDIQQEEMEAAQPVPESSKPAEVVEPDTTTPDPSHPVPMCSNEERLALLNSQCVPQTLDDYTEQQKAKAFFNIFVDQKHKLIACLPPKSGCTTWKNILANNSGDDPLPKGFNMMKLHFGDLPKYGIRTLNTFTKAQQQEMLQTYTKFLVARHPLERFRSAYIDKLESGSDLFMQKQIGAPILHRFRPDLDSHVRDTGKGVTIDLFTRYLKETHLFNAHWHPVHDLCLPCAINYDYVLKTETLDHDNEPLILKYLQPYTRGIGTRGNVVAGGHQASSLSPAGRELEIYLDSSITDMTYLEEMYKDDFTKFGYSWKFALNEQGKYTVRSSCVNGAVGKQCC